MTVGSPGIRGSFGMVDLRGTRNCVRPRSEMAGQKPGSSIKPGM
jgi:hypothetical protein